MTSTSRQTCFRISCDGVTQDLSGFQLKLRACGGGSGKSFELEESIWTSPSSTEVKNQVRLVKNETESYTMMHESEFMIKDEVLRVTSLNQSALIGDIPNALRAWNFVKNYTVVRKGRREVIGECVVEYFRLWDRVQNEMWVSKAANAAGEDEWVVFVYKDVMVSSEVNAETFLQAKMHEVSRLINRLAPELVTMTVHDVYNKKNEQVM